MLAPLLPRDPEAAPDAAHPAHDPALQRALGYALLRFTPRVSLLDEAVLLEVRASLRLFGGGRALRGLVAQEARRFGSPGMAAAPTALGALARARCPGQGPRLDDLPLQALTAAARQSALLARLGCRTLGDLCRLPRAGLARRFGAGLLRALDQARGLAPDRLDWLVLPERFDARLELPGRVEDAVALMAGARRLLVQLSGWLAARQAGVRAVVLHWQHEFRPRRERPDDPQDAGQLTVRTAQATRDMAHLARLMGELLAHVRLAAPVGELRLVADEIEPLPHEGAGLALDHQGACPREGASLDELLERLAARLGPQHVLRPVRRSDHRPEAMQHWAEAAHWQVPPDPGPAATGLPQPAWLLPRPLLLRTRGERPWHAGGPLLLLSNPHRIEAGWWDHRGAGTVRRDYYVAWSERAGLLWIYRQRPPGEGWFLHGVFG